MGEARRRGTLEQRIAQATVAAREAQARREADQRALERMRAANERQRLATIAAMLPEAAHRAIELHSLRTRNRHLRLALVMGLAASFGEPTLLQRPFPVRLPEKDDA